MKTSLLRNLAGIVISVVITQFLWLRNYLEGRLKQKNTIHNLYYFASIYHFRKDSADISGVTVQFLIWPAVRFKREVLFGWLDLLVSFGGIAGLFLGFSLLSAVEIIYYFTLRTVCMVYKNRVRKYNFIYFYI